MGLALFSEPSQSGPRRPSCLAEPGSLDDCYCCLDNACSQSRDQEFCRHLAAPTWVTRRYDPGRSLQETITTCLGHDRFTYWGAWTPSGTGRRGVYKLIVRANYPWVAFSDGDITSLSKPHHPDALFCLERCSARRACCCLKHLQEPLYEIELALLQQGAFRVGDETLHVFQKNKFRDLGTF